MKVFSVASLSHHNYGLSATLQIIVPSALLEEVLTELHGGMVSAAISSNCSTCAVRTPEARAPLTSIVTRYPLQLVAMDIVIPSQRPLEATTTSLS